MTRENNTNHEAYTLKTTNELRYRYRIQYV